MNSPAKNKRDPGADSESPSASSDLRRSGPIANLRASFKASLRPNTIEGRRLRNELIGILVGTLVAMAALFFATMSGVLPR